MIIMVCLVATCKQHFILRLRVLHVIKYGTILAVSHVTLLFRKALRVQGMIPEIEEWIERNKCKAKYLSFNTLRPEPKYPDEYFYHKRVDGVRIGSMGVYLEDSAYWVVFGRSGRPCGSSFAFSSEEQRQLIVPQVVRFVFCVRRLARWSKVDFEHKDAHTLQAMIAIDEAQLYCMGVETECETLLSLVCAGGKEIKGVVYEEPVSQPEEGMEWGTTITPSVALGN